MEALWKLLERGGEWKSLYNTEIVKKKKNPSIIPELRHQPQCQLCAHGSVVMVTAQWALMINARLLIVAALGAHSDTSDTAKQRHSPRKMLEH